MRYQFQVPAFDASFFLMVVRWLIVLTIAAAAAWLISGFVGRTQRDLKSEVEGGPSGPLFVRRSRAFDERSNVVSRSKAELRYWTKSAMKQPTACVVACRGALPATMSARASSRSWRVATGRSRPRLT